MYFTSPSITPVQLPPYFQIDSWSVSYCQLAFFSQKIIQAWSPKLHFKGLTGTLAHTHLRYKKSIVKLFQIWRYSLYHSTVLAFQRCIFFNTLKSISLILSQDKKFNSQQYVQRAPQYGQFLFYPISQF